jgi:hypothetical protein
MQARIKGWDFVPVDRHPEMSFQGIGDVDPRTSAYVWRGGSVLMERPVEYQELADRQMDEINYKTLLTTPGLEGFAYPAQINTEFFTGTMKEGLKSASFGY